MNNETTPTRPLELKHNQQVTFEGAQYEPAIRVFDTMTAVSGGARLEKLIAIRNCRLHRSGLTTSIQSASVISADYAGKAEELAAKSEAYSAAPVLREGQFVEIEGRPFRVRLARNPQFACDPIHFEPMIDKDDGDEYSQALAAVDPDLAVEDLAAECERLIAEKYS